MILLGCVVLSLWLLPFPLGLDLQGGASFVLEIEQDALREVLRTRKAAQDPSMSSNELDEAINATFPQELDLARERALAVVRSRVDSLGIREPIIFEQKGETQSRIVVQLSGVDTNTIAKTEETIRQVGFLTFHLTHKRNGEMVDALLNKNWVPEGYKIITLRDVSGRPQKHYVPESSATAKVTRIRGTYPAIPGYDVMFMARMVRGTEVTVPAFVARTRLLTGDYLDAAGFDRNEIGEVYVSLEFNNRGALRFKKITEDYGPRGQLNMGSDDGRGMAVVLDGVLYCAPVITVVIRDGKAIITGIQSATDAKRIANVLSAGALPAPIEIVQKHTVGPSLGKDHIRSGTRAVIYGGIGVLAFMLIYYLLSGVVANIALLLDLLILPVGMWAAAGFLGLFAGTAGARSALNLPVLTLPGIAGILLTIGIAVDANVLIFERIREESRLGKTIKAAIAAGYDRAFVTIVDANVTTLLTAVILFVFGSGAVRGFAVTLAGGIVVSMFTALVVTRLIFDIIADKTRITKLRMLAFIRDTNINFVGKRLIAAVLSLAVIAGTWTMLVVKYGKDHGRVFGVDFTGGAVVAFLVNDFDNRPAEFDIRDALDSGEMKNVKVRIQYRQSVGDVASSDLLVRVGAGTDNEASVRSVAIKKIILSKFGAMGLEEGSAEHTGPQVGREMRTKAVVAIIVALVGIVIYISFRFRFSFALGAIVALTHDVLITAGVFCVFFDRQITLPIIAALLTILGYSVNDTIVVFDRIREDLKDSDLRRTKSFSDICNLSINQTLSRTILTSLTTLIAVGALLVFGGGAIRDLALALCIGVLVGTYSSIFVATPMVLLCHRGKMPSISSS